MAEQILPQEDTTNATATNSLAGDFVLYPPNEAEVNEHFRILLPDAVYDEIDIELIDDYAGHPEYGVHPFDLEHMELSPSFLTSIKMNGVLSEPSIRQKPNGRFEMLSGHKRKYAASQAGQTTLKVKVFKELDDESAALYVSHLNKQTDPSKNFIARLRDLKLMSIAYGRKGLEGTGFNNVYDFLEAQEGMDAKKIQRLCTLADLIPALQYKTYDKEFHGTGKENRKGRPLAASAAEHLARLDQKSQQVVLDFMEKQGEDWAPTAAQTKKLRFEIWEKKQPPKPISKKEEPKPAVPLTKKEVKSALEAPEKSEQNSENAAKIPEAYVQVNFSDQFYFQNFNNYEPEKIMLVVNELVAGWQRGDFVIPEFEPPAPNLEALKEFEADAPEADAPEAAAPETDAPEAAAPEADAPEAAALEADAPEAAAPEVDAPKADAPEAAAPEVDAPKADAPKAAAPEADAPKAAALEADAPEAAAPEVDAPKADAPKAAAPEADVSADLDNLSNASKPSASDILNGVVGLPQTTEKKIQLVTGKGADKGTPKKTNKRNQR